MRNKIKKISSKNLIVKPPVQSTLVLLLILKVYKAPEWVWGASLALFIALFWGVYIFGLIKYETEEIDIFYDKDNKI